MEEVHEFTYLGSKLTTDGDSEAEAEINKDQHQNQAEDFQEQCPWGLTLRGRVMEGDTGHLPETGRVPDKMPEANIKDILAHDYIQ